MKPEEFESRIDGIIKREREKLEAVAVERLEELGNAIYDVPEKVGKELTKYGEDLRGAFELKEILGVERVLDIMESGGLVHSWIKEPKYGGDITLRRVLEQMDNEDEFLWSSASNFQDTKMKVTIVIEPISEIAKEEKKKGLFKK